MSKLAWALGIINAASLLLIFIWIAVTVPAQDMDFYRKEYDKYGIAQSIGVEKGDLMEVTKYLVDYMMGRNADLVISVPVNGEYREFFNQLEKDHMVDVRNLFAGGRKLFMLSIGAFIFTVALFFKNRYPLKIFAKSHLIVALSFLGLVFLLTSLIAINFEHAFTIFHEIFFANDLWQLNPATDLLINIVPLEFFIDISILAGCILGAQLIFVIAAAGFCIRTLIIKSKE